MGRAATPATKCFSTGRGLGYDTSETRLWRRHLDREHLAAANLVCNRLDGRETGLSFLQSSTSAAGGWEKGAFRRNSASMMLQRLDSRGRLAGPLQLASSFGTLPALSSGDLSADFDSSPLQHSRSSLFGSRSSFGRPGTATPPYSAAHGRPATANSLASIGFGSSSSSSLSFTLHDADRPRLRPPPLISEQGGYRSSVELAQRAASFSSLR